MSDSYKRRKVLCYKLLLLLLFFEIVCKFQNIQNIISFLLFFSSSHLLTVMYKNTEPKYTLKMEVPPMELSPTTPVL